jgi:adenylylsulfate kinase-like enzyme
MIWWIYGQSGAGKTTLAKHIGGVHLDGDEMRKCWHLGFSEEDRRENNLRIAKIAKMLSDQGHTVVVSTICPYEDLRKEVYFICKCRFIKIEGEFNG